MPASYFSLRFEIYFEPEAYKWQNIKYYLQILCMHNSNISGSNEEFCSPILIKPVMIMFFNEPCMIDLFRLYI